MADGDYERRQQREGELRRYARILAEQRSKGKAGEGEPGAERGRGAKRSG